MALVTWNPSDKNASTTLSADYLTATGAGLATGVRATLGRSTGKWYWEYKIVTTGQQVLGIANSSATLAWISGGAYGNTVRGYSASGVLYTGNLPYGGVHANDNIIGVALDLDNGTIEFYKNGISQGIAFSDISVLGTPVFPYFSNSGSSFNPVITANFGATAFAYPETLEALGGGWSSYDGNQVNTIEKYLIKQSDNYYSIKTEFYDVGTYTPLVLDGGTAPNNSDFINNGIEDLNDLLTTNTNGVVISNSSTLGTGNVFSFGIKGDFKSIINIK